MINNIFVNWLDGSNIPIIIDIRNGQPIMQNNVYTYNDSKNTLYISYNSFLQSMWITPLCRSVLSNKEMQ